MNVQSSNRVLRVLFSVCQSVQRKNYFLIESEAKNAPRYKQPGVVIGPVKPFDPVRLLGEGWIIHSNNTRASQPTQVDLESVAFAAPHSQERGEDMIDRISNRRVCLGANVFLTLWENQHLIPERWKNKTKNVTSFIHFDGTILENQIQKKFTLCLYWSSGRWCFYANEVTSPRNFNELSAVFDA